MQYILTQEEYDELANKSNKDLLDQYDRLYDKLYDLGNKHAELKDKYAKLLVHDVALNNERLKSTKG